LRDTDCELQLNDSELVGLTRRGSMDAFDILVGRYRKSMYRLARAMTQDHDAADDLSQEAFVQAYRRIRQLKKPESFGPWLRKILVNVCIRHSAKAVHASLEDTEIDSPESPSAEAEKSMVRARVRNAILELDPAERAVVLLYYMDGLKQIEIADAIGHPVGTVWSRLNSARCKLRGRLADLVS
jgi:RNA polymerase sigma-70 factor (ECF subfamily)